MSIVSQKASRKRSCSPINPKTPCTTSFDRISIGDFSSLLDIPLSDESTTPCSQPCVHQRGRLSHNANPALERVKVKPSTVPMIKSLDIRNPGRPCGRSAKIDSPVEVMMRNVGASPWICERSSASVADLQVCHVERYSCTQPAWPGNIMIGDLQDYVSETFLMRRRYRWSCLVDHMQYTTTAYTLINPLLISLDTHSHPSSPRQPSRACRLPPCLHRKSIRPEPYPKAASVQRPTGYRS